MGILWASVIRDHRLEYLVDLFAVLVRATTVADPDGPGPFLCKSLQACKAVKTFQLVKTSPAQSLHVLVPVAFA